MELSYFALIGAPNCGKTVLFNGLTGSHAKVANYPGVTVDKREGAFLDDEAVRIIDLPGTYSLRTTSPDEAVAKDVMVGKMGIPPDAIIAVADATNLRMTLRMILELKTLGLPMVVSLNMSDVARRRGLNIDAAKLSELLDAPVLETVAVSASGVQAVREAVAKLPRKRSFPANPASAERTLDALDSDQLYREVESAIFYDSIFAACFEFYKERPREYHSYSVIVYIEVLCPSEKQFALHHIECSSRRSFAYFHLYLAPRCCQGYFGIVQFEQIFVRLTFIERERKVHRHRSIKIR